MARAKASEPRKAKLSAAEELSHGIAKLRELTMQIDDLSRDGFPYREAGRARTELSLRETIRRVFGEKSPEYQAHKTHKLRVGTRAESVQSTTLIKQLIASLERQQTDLSGLTSPAPVPPIPPKAPPALTSIPVNTPSDHLPAPLRPNEPTLVTDAMPPAPDVDSSPVLAPMASVESVRGTENTHEPDASSSPARGGTENVPSAIATEKTTPVLSTSAQCPPAPAPRIPTCAIDATSPLDSRLGMAATSLPSASTPSIISQGPIPPPTETRRPSADTPASQSETALSRHVPDSLQAQPSALSSLTPATPIEHSGGIVVPSPPDTPCTVVPHAPSDVWPTQPPSSLTPKPTEPMTPTRESSEAPSALLSPRKTTPASGQPENSTLEILRRVCARFHLVARQLRLRKEYRPTLELTDEYDLQDLFYALLRLQFDEVGTEEWIPDYTNGACRTSYLLDWDRTVVIVKQTRSGLTTKDLAEQVKSDVARYARRPNGNTLICFIYDPDGRVGNPRGLEADLTTVSDTHMVEVIVAPK
jgi:hypothetical protein